MTKLTGAWVIWCGFWAAFWLVFYVPLTGNFGGMIAGAASIGAAFAPSLYERWTNASSHKSKTLHSLLTMRDDVPDDPAWKPVHPATARAEQTADDQSRNGNAL